MSSNTQKFVGAILLFAMWGVFAWMGKTPADGFITAIGAAIAGLGIYHARGTSDTSTQPPDVPASPATAAEPPAPPAQ